MTNPMQPLDPIAANNPVTPADTPSSPSGFARVTPHGRGPAPYDLRAGGGRDDDDRARARRWAQGRFGADRGAGRGAADGGGVGRGVPGTRAARGGGAPSAAAARRWLTTRSSATATAARSAPS